MPDRHASPIIGIIGGMGPYAGIDLARKVFEETDAGTDQEHLPLALVSLPDRIGDRSAFLQGTSKVNPGTAIFESIARLAATGASVAGMACVTAHADPILSEARRLLEASSHRIRLLSIVDETVAFIRSSYPQLRSVAALSTTGTFENRIFLTALHEAGFNTVSQSAEVQQNLVQRSIFDPKVGIKAKSNPVTRAARQMVHDAVTHVRDLGAEVVILGCTELPLAVAYDAIPDVILVDPTRALARALIGATYPDRLLASSL